MTTSWRSFGAILCLTFFWTMGASAQTIEKRLSLEEAVGMGVAHNLTLEAARQDQAASGWGLRQAYSNWLPKVEVASGYIRLDNETVRRANVFTDIGRELGEQFGGAAFDPDDIKPSAYRESYSTHLAVIQPIYNGGAEWSGIRMATQAHKISQYALKDAEQETTLRIKRAYFGVLKAQEVISLAQEATSATEEHLRQVRRKFEVGSGNRADVLRWEVQLAQDLGNAVEAENGLAIARAVLNESMGVGLEENWKLVPVSMDEVGAHALPEDRIGPSLAVHPSVQTAQACVALGQTGVRMAQSGFAPKINVAYNHSWEQDDTIGLDGDNTWNVSVQAQFPIFNSFGDYAGVRKAKAEKRRAETTAENVRKGILLQATRASLNLKSAHTRISIARKEVSLAQESLRVVQNGYDVGTLSSLDLIDSQLSNSSARAHLIHAVYDYCIAEAELARAMGR
ncbi:MAG: TolC family protein [Candidatus Latescibacterota bacterium]